MMKTMKKRGPILTVGIIDGKRPIEAELEGKFVGEPFFTFSGRITAYNSSGAVLLKDEKTGRTFKSPVIKLKGDENTCFTLFQVAIGKGFHWERSENQRFKGDLVFKARCNGTLVAINEIKAEEYLMSVISSEMNPEAPLEFLKVHAIMSRSWLLSGLEREKEDRESHVKKTDDAEEGMIRWYERDEHDIYQICADDHCQRYQGISKIFSKDPIMAVKETEGIVLKYRGRICDTRYSKCCGGFTEIFSTAWADRDVAYLKSISDGERGFSTPEDEEGWKAWFSSRPDAYCNTEDIELLSTILQDFDRGTKDFFRWKVWYKIEEIEEIIKDKTGIDIGRLIELKPLKRGPSGRISHLKIIGSKKEITVGKELEIRRVLSKSHLLSSAFTVNHIYNKNGLLDKVILLGAGWGHGVGLCQIGAAVMARKGFGAEDILKHYFPDTTLEKLY